ncbi:putative ubiquitin carboxyl-terminal hydrolase family protein [Botrytis fragariae]|uniref:Putative ubiquitin carboxyl-terminal hydrolase family protein n=1 Tax=Botrytis fragariae TaxID=1964551 RepID=A0A8H6AYQ7_9HELO|nr:putative ubiquitin carboxyl-terminal hydrolase family protein [Botrytis fragariae]KAF5876073.1 putative ubiquitin carboxyl-terminal hydrolase family protein [Botrytis fragariae]
MSTSHPAPLPPSRDFMTSLFNSLTSPTSSPTSPIQISNTSTDSNTNTTSASISHTQRFAKENETDNQNHNPLKQIDAQKKALLMTLHVIFPPPLLLHALDLLDRGGVGRVILEEGDVEEGDGKREGGGDRRDGERRVIGEIFSGAGKQEVEGGGNVGVENTGVGETVIDASLSPKTKPKTLYQVRSSQPPKWHSSRSTSTSGAATGTGTGHTTAENTYTVHLDAWNCSCAAFAFSAFPASSSSSSSSTYPLLSTSTLSTSYFPWGLERSPDEESSMSVEKGKKEEGEEEKWRYGGWTKTSQVPICKHLLACLLVERWGDVLGMYVRERVVGRDEMGGLVV